MNMLYPHPIPARVLVLHLLTSGSNSSPPFFKVEVCCHELRWLWACRGKRKPERNLHRTENARSEPALWGPRRGRWPGVSGGRPPNPSPSFPPSFLSFSQLSFWAEADFYQSSFLQQAVKKHKHVNHRPRGSGFCKIKASSLKADACLDFHSPSWQLYPD